jgi:hypothetical protein
MKVLIYKRTHKGDPDKNGIFGNQDCMGKIRNWDYDAVIGIGGNAPWKKDADIKHKINWIGLDPKKIYSSYKRGDEVVFSHFELYEETGVNICEKFPNLFEYMYGNRKRFDMSTDLPEEVFEEVKQILDSIKNSPSSKSFPAENIDTLEAEIALQSVKCSGCFRGKDVEITIQEC